MMLFGVDIENLSRGAVLAKVDSFLRGSSFHWIVTVNPEFLLEAERDPAFRQVLTESDLRVVDGFGVVLAGWLRGVRLRRYPGADLMEDILVKAEREGFPVFFAVRKDGLSIFDDVARAVRKKYPRLVFSGKDVDFGGGGNRHAFVHWRDWGMEDSMIVLCNAGMPEQELFVAGLEKERVPLRLGMGVGGAFDFLTGKRKRAPEWMRVIGLEWLWRLLLQPKRAHRIWNSTAVFLRHVLMNEIKNRHHR